MYLFLFSLFFLKSTNNNIQIPNIIFKLVYNIIKKKLICKLLFWIVVFLTILLKFDNGISKINYINFF